MERPSTWRGDEILSLLSAEFLIVNVAATANRACSEKKATNEQWEHATYLSCKRGRT